MIHVRQKGSNGAVPEEKWVQVKLLTARPGPLPYKDAVFPTSALRGDDAPFTMSTMIEAQESGWGWWGRWRLGANSVNSSVDNQFSVGSAHKDSRYWAYNFKTNELHLVQRTMESGWAEKSGGPPTGYKVVYSPALELWGAGIDARGIRPSRGDEGTGWVKIASRILRPERVFWEKTFAA